MTAKKTKPATRKPATRKSPAKKDPKALMKNLNLHTTYALDMGAIRDGVWRELRNDIRVKLRPYMNKEFAAYLEKLRAPHKNEIRQGKKLSEEVAIKYAVEALCAEVLVDWEGVTFEENGEVKEVPYNAEFAFSILGQPEYSQLTDEIIRLSQEEEHYRAAYTEESEKN